MSNDDWKNPHDPDAKIGPTKAGAIDMMYKPEHTVDLDTGAILQAEVRLGHEADQKDLALHVLQAQANLNQAQDRPADALTIQSATGGQGLFRGAGAEPTTAGRIRTVISDPIKTASWRNFPRKKPRWCAKPAQRAERVGQEIAKEKRYAPGTEFCPSAGCGRGPAHDVEGIGKLKQTLQTGGGNLQSVATDEEIMGVGTPKQWAAGVKTLGWILGRLFAVGWSRFVNGIARWITVFGCRGEQSRTRLAGWVKNKATAFFRAPCLDLRKRIYQQAAKPVFCVQLLAVLPAREDQHIHTAMTQEELVRGVRDDLPGKIPDMRPHGVAPAAQFPRPDINPLGFRLVSTNRSSINRRTMEVLPAAPRPTNSNRTSSFKGSRPPRILK